MFSIQKNSLNTASNPYNPSIPLILVAACKTKLILWTFYLLEVHLKETLLENNFFVRKLLFLSEIFPNNLCLKTSQMLSWNNFT